MEFLIFAALLGLIPAAIASNKGRSFGLWWFYGTALFIVALPMAIMMKAQDQGGENVLRKCPKCAELIQPDATVCKHCHAEVTPLTDNEKTSLPKKASESNRVPSWLTAVALIVVVGFIWAMAGSGGGTSGMQGIYNQVSADAVKQYEIAKRSGSAMDACVHAGMVAAAYLQAKDETNYQSWKSTESSDCTKAGLPR